MLPHAPSIFCFSYRLSDPANVNSWTKLDSLKDYLCSSRLHKWLIIHDFFTLPLRHFPQAGNQEHTA